MKYKRNQSNPKLDKANKVIKVIYAYDDAFRAVRTTWNSDVYIEKAMDNLYQKAIKLGANAVLGVQLSVLDSGKPFLLGTAVVLEDE